MGLDVALLLDTESLQKWEHRAIRHLLDESDLEINISLILVNDQDVSSSLGEKISTFVTDFSVWKCCIAVKMLKTAVTGAPWYRKQVALKQTVNTADVEKISCKPKPAEDFGNVLPGYAVSALGDVDVAIRFGFGVLKGEALTAPTYGVLSYHHGDISEYRGRPSGFYEFIHEQTTAGITIQQLSEELDGGTVAATTKCDIDDATSLRDVRSKLFAASPSLLSEAVERVVMDQLPEQPETLGPLYSTPDASDVATYLLRRLNNS